MTTERIFLHINVGRESHVSGNFLIAQNLVVVMYRADKRQFKGLWKKTRPPQFLLRNDFIIRFNVVSAKLDLRKTAKVLPCSLSCGAELCIVCSFSVDQCGTPKELISKVTVIHQAWYDPHHWFKHSKRAYWIPCSFAYWCPVLIISTVKSPPLHKHSLIFPEVTSCNI